MEVVLWLLVAMVLGAVATVGTATFVAVRAVSRANRVVPELPSPSPTTWLWSPKTPARLHRRLRRAVLTSRATVSRTQLQVGLDDAISGIERHAAEIDEQLTIAARAPQPARGRMLRELHRETVELEAVCQQLMRLTRAFDGSAERAPALDAVRQRLDALEGAVRELDGVEAPGTRRPPLGG